MMTLLIAAMPGNEAMVAKLAALLNAESVAIEVHKFPDEETLIRIPGDIGGRDLALVCSLDRPNTKFLPLLFAASAARDAGAARVGLIAPHLAYMRQDAQFRPGEAISANVLAAALSRSVDWLLTVEPHLHRIHSLETIFDISAKALHATLPIAEWVSREVSDPVLIGPDEESAQWVSEVADKIHCPFVTLKKTRRGDNDVEIALPDTHLLHERTPVVLDDIISTGRTMAQTVRQLVAAHTRPPVCVGVHAIFAGDAYETLVIAGAGRIVTTNTIVHKSNAIDITPLLVQGLRDISGNEKHG
ncbi:MAG TPA: ribose-phosphate diphosphokinase [Steroidobacteraceae bacterium]|nr:ribose-phosphate diphosphokinase [Steroidobacteraceae bacterium]